MLIFDTPIDGLKIIEFECASDERGHFVRTFCARSFQGHALNPTIAQANLSFTRSKGTIRGLHYQLPPATEIKVVRCTRGAIFDVVVDVRPESQTFLQHFALKLRADDRRALYIPERFANGYQSLTVGAEASYHSSGFYTPSCESGLRFDDPQLALPWPLPPTVVSAKDRAWPLIDSERLAELRRTLIR